MKNLIRPLRLIVNLLLLVTVSSCVQTPKSELEFEVGNGKYVGPQDAPAIIQNKCASCHTDKENGSFAFFDEEDWKKSKYIHPGNADRSYLVQRLRNSGNHIIGEHDMPPEPRTALSSKQIDIIKEWINGMVDESLALDCPESKLKNNESEQRFRYQTAQVPYGTICKRETQVRTCKDAKVSNFSGTYTHVTCIVLEKKEEDVAVPPAMSMSIMNSPSPMVMGEKYIVDVNCTTGIDIQLTAPGFTIESKNQSGTYILESKTLCIPNLTFRVTPGRSALGAKKLTLSQTKDGLTGTFELSTNTIEITLAQRAVTALNQSCMGCHGGSGGTNWKEESGLNLKTEADWIAFANIKGNRIKPGYPQDSGFVKRMLHGTGSQSMPPSFEREIFDNFTKQNYQDIYDWIGSLDKKAPSEDDNNSNPFSCLPSGDKSQHKLKRLSARQYINTVIDLMRQFTNSTYQQQVEELIRPIVARVPTDSAHNYERLDQIVSDDQVHAYINIAQEVATVIVNSGGKTDFVGNCNIQTANCKTNFVKKFGALAFRRPLNQAEVDFYKAITSTQDSFMPIFVALLASPQFLYKIEDGTDDGKDNGTYKLTDYELATRLSYHFWQTMPDVELTNLAQSGALSDSSVYKLQVQRLLNNSRAKNSLDEFYYYWPDLSETPDSKSVKVTAAGRSFFSDIKTEDASVNFRKEMTDEILHLGNYYTRVTEGKFSDLFNSKISFIKDAKVSKIYGVPGWNGSYSAENLVTFGDSKRSGLLTRAAMVSSGQITTRPIVKGVRIKRKILCGTIPPPPPNAEEKAIPASAVLTTRQRVHQSTSGQGCISCHATFNSLGFATENYDSLGRLRKTENHYKNYNVDEFTVLPIETSSYVGNIFPEHFDVLDGTELNSVIADSVEAKSCFAKNYYRFTFSNDESNLNDGCALGKMYKDLDESSLKTFFEGVTHTDQFKRLYLNK